MLSDVVPSLVAKVSELSLLIVETERALDRLKRDLAYVEGTMKVFDPLGHPPADHPTMNGRMPVPLFAYGEMPRIVTKLLQESVRPMSVGEIAAAALRTKRVLRPAPNEAKQIKTHIGRFLSRMKRQGKFVGERYDGRIMLWSVKPIGMMSRQATFSLRNVR